MLTTLPITPAPKSSLAPPVESNSLDEDLEVEDAADFCLWFLL